MCIRDRIICSRSHRPCITRVAPHSFKPLPPPLNCLRPEEKRTIKQTSDSTTVNLQSLNTQKTTLKQMGRSKERQYSAAVAQSLVGLLAALAPPRIAPASGPVAGAGGGDVGRGTDGNRARCVESQCTMHTLWRSHLLVCPSPPSCRGLELAGGRL